MITDEKIFFERAICIHCDIDYTQTGEKLCDHQSGDSGTATQLQ